MRTYAAALSLTHVYTSAETLPSPLCTYFMVDLAIMCLGLLEKVVARAPRRFIIISEVYNINEVYNN